jgi:hypothetical protein
LPYRLQADLLVLLHFAFILFALFGGFIVLWRRWVAWPSPFKVMSETPKIG